MVTMGVFPFQGKTHIVEPGIEPGTSWLVVRNSDHQATRLVPDVNLSTSILRRQVEQGVCYLVGQVDTLCGCLFVLLYARL